MRERDGMKADEYVRIYNIRPPALDPEQEHPAPDCGHPDAAGLFFAPDSQARTETNTERQARFEREREARLVCASCPFLVACALHGLEHEDYGIWGGLSEQDRRGLGGRGRAEGAPGRTPGPETVMRRLLGAGVPVTSVKRLLREWGKRRRQDDEEAA